LSNDKDSGRIVRLGGYGKGYVQIFVYSYNSKFRTNKQQNY